MNAATVLGDACQTDGETDGAVPRPKRPSLACAKPASRFHKHFWPGSKKNGRADRKPGLAGPTRADLGTRRCATIGAPQFGKVLAGGNPGNVQGAARDM